MVRMKITIPWMKFLLITELCFVPMFESMLFSKTLLNAKGLLLMSNPFINLPVR